MKLCCQMGGVLTPSIHWMKNGAFNSSAALKITCCTMLALYWKQTTHIFDDAHSLAFIACVFVLCQVCSRRA